jgi:pyruvate dehydrogenase complex dehydrogenase (E1) component
MVIDVTRTIKQTVQVKIESVGSIKELRKKALELARYQLAHSDQEAFVDAIESQITSIDDTHDPDYFRYEGDDITYKITNIV